MRKFLIGWMIMVLMSGCAARKSEVKQPDNTGALTQIMSQFGDKVASAIRDASPKNEIPVIANPFQVKAEDGKKKEEIYVTNVFRDRDIRDVLSDISAETNVQILFDDSVQGIINIGALTNAPLEKALECVLAGGGYEFIFKDGRYYVGSTDPQSPNFKIISTTEVIPTYAKPDDIIAKLADIFKPYVKPDKTTNSLAITATPNLMLRIKDDLESIDPEPTQFVIEVIATDVRTDKNLELGVKGSNITLETVGSGIFANHLKPVFSGNTTSSILHTLGILAKEGNAKIRAKPNIVAMDGKEARIEIPVKQYYSLISPGNASTYYGNRIESVEAKPVSLKITPKLTRDKKILLAVNLKAEDMTSQKEQQGKGVTQELPEVKGREIETTLLVENAQTVIFGGLYTEVKKKVVEKIPILGSIPILNFFFSFHKTSTENIELLFLITPRILTPQMIKTETENAKSKIEKEWEGKKK